MSEKDILELLDKWQDDDHLSGCPGREYSCSCNFDEMTSALMGLVKGEIVGLRSEVERLTALSSAPKPEEG
jgi:redox-regulated HSP33 family molecular chaperone